LIPALRTLNFTDKTLSLAFGYIDQAIDAISRLAIVNGRLEKATVLTAGVVTPVSHKLGRKPLGYFIVNRDAQATVWTDPAVNDNEDLFLNLQTSANVTVALWIF
jgi:hypothetical protein